MYKSYELYSSMYVFNVNIFPQVAYISCAKHSGINLTFLKKYHFHFVNTPNGLIFFLPFKVSYPIFKLCKSSIYNTTHLFANFDNYTLEKVAFLLFDCS